MAETGISRDIKAINDDIARLRDQAKKAADAVKTLQVDLQFNPKSIENITNKYAALRKQLDKVNELQATYNEKLAKLKADKLEQTGKAAEATQRQIEKLENTINKTALTIKTLEYQSSEAAENLEKNALAAEKFEKKLAPVEKTAQKVSKAAAALVTALTLLVKKTIEAGNELYSLSVRYEASAESLQAYNRQLEIATGQTDLYTSALAALSNGFKEIVSGRGVAYETALRNIGLSSKELLTMNMEQRYQAIFEALQNVTDESVRTANAQKLLGDSGAYIAQVAGMSADELERVNAMTSQYGILSTEQVEQLHEAYIAWQNFKSQLMIVAAEIIPAILPLIKTLAQWIGTLAEGFNSLSDTSKGALLIALFAATVLPKVIGFMKTMVLWSTLLKGARDKETIATYNATAAATALNTATAAWQGIIMAISIILMAIVGIIGRIRKQTKGATDELSTLIDQASILNGVGGDFSSTAEMTTTYQNDRTITMDITITGQGDTILSDDAASKVALITADTIQKQLGGLLL